MRSSENTLSHLYDVRARLPFDGHTYQGDVVQDVDIICNLLPSRATRICDVGCGCGWHLEELAKRGYTSLCGIDVSSLSLHSFTQRCTYIKSGIIAVSHSDVESWAINHRYDLVTCFLPCIGEFGRKGDISFLEACNRLLVSNGTFVLKIFCEELISRLIGTFTSQFSSTSPIFVKTTVVYNLSTKYLRIDQETSISDIQVPSEAIRVYTIDEIIELMRQANFSDIHVQSTDAEYAVQLVAHKRAHGSSA
jgi:2-polyprenyl-3-methyl-5-hydroxy-6-metoxy-1,4-benzoquinol methylase